MGERSDAIGGVELTAFYCCAQRERDAREADPLCGDTYASRFVVEPVRERLAPLLADGAAYAICVARHRLVDDLLSDELARDPDRRVLVVGAGFDTRAYRLPGGRWVEIEHPSILAVKEAALPASAAPRPLERVAHDFRHEPLADALAPHAGRDEALVVLEGVTPYLDAATLGTLARTLLGALPRARLYADISTSAYRRWFGAGTGARLAELGAAFAPAERHPREVIESAGWRAIASASIAERARAWRPGLLPRTGSRHAEVAQREGYAVWTFAPPSA